MPTAFYREALLYEPMPRQPTPGTVRCTACEHWCVLRPGEVGKCGVRANLEGTLRLLVYARAIALHVDPVEKKPLYHFLPGEPILSLGTVGCNLRCQFCQNWEISQRRVSPAELAGGRLPQLGRELPPEHLVEICLAEGIPMIAFTYNEPVVAFEYALDTFRLAKEAGILTVFVSSGFETTRAIETIGPYLDAANIDLKAWSDRFYREICGARLRPVLRNIEEMARAGIWVEVTTLLIPGLNDSPEEVAEAAAWLASVSPDLVWHLTAFHPDYKMLDRPPTPHATLLRAYRQAKEAGLRYVYLGNVRDPGRETTACPCCGSPLIARDWYRVRVLTSRPGVCDRCGTRVPGVWGRGSEDRVPLSLQAETGTPRGPAGGLARTP
jgi:pyruvate formate lyase activating enzyme